MGEKVAIVTGGGLQASLTDLTAAGTRSGKAGFSSWRSAARFLISEKAVEVFGRTYSPTYDPPFQEVDQSVQLTLSFPSGTIASCASSYGMREWPDLRVHTPGTAIEFADASSNDRKQLRAAYRNGKAEGVDGWRTTTGNQFLPEIANMAECVATGGGPHTLAEEGLHDQRLMASIYQSAAGRRPVKLSGMDRFDATSEA